MARCVALPLGLFAVASASAQLDGSMLSIEHPAIDYRSERLTNAVADLQRRLDAGTTELAYDARPGVGYLPALLRELGVPVESQLLVYSRTSLQQRAISPARPRSIYFNDEVAIGAVHDGFIEVAAHDARQGAVFYTLEQTPGKPRLVREGRCLGCHYSLTTLGVPGFFARSIPTATDGQTLPWLGNATVTHATPLEERWGGWYVTGDVGANRHLGNLLIADRRATELPALEPAVPEALRGVFATTLLTPYSDVVAHLVFEHQIEIMNVLTRIGWEFRVAAAEGRSPETIERSVADAVDHLLFVGEAELEPVRGTSGFAERFMSAGPRDREGRSLRDLRLSGRLMRYPMSYMVYSRAFDALPTDARAALYRRLWDVLSGAERDERYAHLSSTDREAIVSILLDTKDGLPPYYEPLSRRDSG